MREIPVEQFYGMRAAAMFAQANGTAGARTVPHQSNRYKDEDYIDTDWSRLEYPAMMNFDDCRFWYARIAHENGINRCTFHRCDFHGACLFGTAFLENSFIGSTFHNASMTDSEFYKCDFKRCTFLGADLSGSAFYRCDFREADLTGANFENCIFKDCLLPADVLSQARGSRLNQTFTDPEVLQEWERRPEEVKSAEAPQRRYESFDNLSKPINQTGQGRVGDGWDGGKKLETLDPDDPTKVVPGSRFRTADDDWQGLRIEELKSSNLAGSDPGSREGLGYGKLPWHRFQYDYGEEAIIGQQETEKVRRMEAEDNKAYEAQQASLKAARARNQSQGLFGGVFSHGGRKR